MRGPLFARCAQVVPFPSSTPLLNAQAVLQGNIHLKLERIPLKFACRVTVENILAQLPLPVSIVSLAPFPRSLALPRVKDAVMGNTLLCLVPPAQKNVSLASLDNMCFQEALSAPYVYQVFTLT